MRILLLVCCLFFIGMHSSFAQNNGGTRLRPTLNPQVLKESPKSTAKLKYNPNLSEAPRQGERKKSERQKEVMTSNAANGDGRISAAEEQVLKTYK